jgi:hypothetical protein
VKRYLMLAAPSVAVWLVICLAMWFLLVGVNQSKL